MRVVLICHAATAATRTAAFPGNEPLDALGVRQSEAIAGTLPRAEQVRSAPSSRCRRTAEAMGLAAVPDAALAGCDYGSWTGRTLDAVAAREPAAVTAWLTDPTARPHGGESIAELLDRVGHWLDGLADPAHQPLHGLLAVADPSVIRAAVVHALDAEARSFWRIDIAPLSQTVLVGNPGRWSLRHAPPREW
jgi:broad specificity phosphatase PhoE